jgi:alpha-glucoside transport system ATP-binding protein
VIAKLQGIHASMKGQSVALTAEPSKVHLFHNGVSLLYPEGRNVTVAPH